jgi:hypothetical protein
MIDCISCDHELLDVEKLTLTPIRRSDGASLNQTVVSGFCKNCNKKKLFTIFERKSDGNRRTTTCEAAQG